MAGRWHGQAARQRAVARAGGQASGGGNDRRVAGRWHGQAARQRAVARAGGQASGGGNDRRVAGRWHGQAARQRAVARAGGQASGGGNDRRVAGRWQGQAARQRALARTGGWRGGGWQPTCSMVCQASQPGTARRPVRLLQTRACDAAARRWNGCNNQAFMTSAGAWHKRHTLEYIACPDGVHECECPPPSATPPHYCPPPLLSLGAQMRTSLGPANLFGGGQAAVRALACCV